jgi:alpha-D-xyloside xylohydrolase
LGHQRIFSNLVWAAGLLFAAPFVFLVACAPQTAHDSSNVMPQKYAWDENAAVIALGDGWLRIQAISDDIIRVSFSRERGLLQTSSLSVLPQAGLRPTVSEDSSSVSISTAKVTARVDLNSGNITFLDPAGKVLLAEQGRTLEAADVQGQKTFHVRQQWGGAQDESLYGLGENQLGLTDLKGYDLDLWQHNGTIVIPLLVSSRGYGIFWDNPSFTRFGDLRAFSAMPAATLLDASGEQGGLTASYFSDSAFTSLITQRRDERVSLERHRSREIIASDPQSPLGDLPPSEGSVRWEGSIAAPATGDYQFQAFSDGQINLWIDGKMVMDQWRQSWLPWKDVAKVRLEGGKKYAIKLEWSRQGGSTIQLLWKPPASDSDSQNISLWSEVGGGVEYYFLNGSRIDDVIAGYRKLTGRAPMMPIWALGLWQSRQRYETAQQSLDVVEGYRSRGIPLDNIVQDWRYWPEGQWGSHAFDPERFPDPAGWIQKIHQDHARLMISVWGKFYPGTTNFDQMKKGGFLYSGTLTEKTTDWLRFNYAFFDAFNAGARKLFWEQIKPALFARGVDAWWLDATEPDLLPRPTLDGQRTNMNPTALGPGSAVLNAYSLMECEAIYDGQRQAAPDKRVFILARSGYAGQQRYAAASWSGDTSSTWQAMHKQIAAGIGFCISGVPYWTMDVGGFSVPQRFSKSDPDPADVQEWCELNTRWFEFCTFCPLLRVHGEFPNREMWEFGGDTSEAYQAQLKFDRLRYQLLPYIYSLAGWVTQRDYTIMRGLAMDFPQDGAARESTDQFMLGPAFLVNPVTEYQARSREVYLPAGTRWYDFWTQKMFEGGQRISAAAGVDSIPVYVRAGSIIPFGPDLQYTGEKPADPIELRVYTGANGQFDLYEDDGVSNAYEKGEFSIIPIRWDEKTSTLTIGKRRGGYPGMLDQRRLNVVFVSETGTGQPQSLKYGGDAIEVPQ